MGNHEVNCQVCGEDLRGLSGGHLPGCDGTKMTPIVDLSPIPQQWINEYAGTMLKAADHFPKDSYMYSSAMLRVEHALDLITAYRERLKK